MSWQQKNIRPKGSERLIFALDVGDEMNAALRLVERLRDHVGLFKVGKEAFTRFGPELPAAILRQGGKVFLDLKFHDIPNTVAAAALQAVKLQVSMFNVHALGGPAMMSRTAAIARETALASKREPPITLAVTVLTSLNDDDLRQLGFTLTCSDLVVRLACLARKAGLAGVVASPHDIVSIRAACGDDFIIVTPGIRMEGETIGDDDQKRVLTPKEAIRRGADYIVVGRPIRTAADPEAQAREIGRQIVEGFELRHHDRQGSKEASS